MGKKEAAKKAKRAAEAAAAAAKSAAAKNAAESASGGGAAAEPAAGLRLAQQIAELAVEAEPETREKMLARHKKELRVRKRAAPRPLLLCAAAEAALPCASDGAD